MHIEIKKNDLLKKLELIARVATKHPTLPILQCVSITTVENGALFSGTNLEIGITSLVSGVVSEEGTVAVPSSLLLQTISLMQDDVITLKTDGEVLVINSRGSQTTVNVFPPQEFPHIPELQGKKERLDGALFALGIKTVAFAASQSTIKPELGSVYVAQKKERSLTFVATDSFRLVEKTVSQSNITLENPLLIPQKNALEIARVLEVMGSDPDCVVGEGQMAFYFKDGTYITTRLTEGSFPDYVQIIPKEFVSHVTLLSADLEHALKMTNLFANKFLQVKLTLNQNTLVVSSDGGESGKTEGRVPASLEGEELALSFNQKYLSDPLAHMPGESVVMHFAGVGRPMVMESVRENTIRYLVMPMNK
ncbi:DNA polymerase III subunit beta [Patescibacteria group bacterium]|nr:DNA polymerase III subunit beta [Patescibacteria group bacterium]